MANIKLVKKTFLGGRINYTRSPLYSLHIQIGRWILLRETPETQRLTKQLKGRGSKGNTQ